MAFSLVSYYRCEQLSGKQSSGRRHNETKGERERQRGTETEIERDRQRKTESDA